MTDDELIDRLRQSLANHASTVKSPPDAWQSFQQSGDQTLHAPRDRSARVRWLTTSAVAAALAVAAAALIFLLRSPSSGGSKVKFVAPPSTAAVVPTTSPPRSTSPTTAAGAAAGAPPSSGPAGGPVPKNFSPESVTFVSLTSGWVLGTAPCASPPCTSVVRTSDGGKTWVGIPAPRTSGVHEIRFADLNDGWAYGNELWVTHDGGAHWTQLHLDAVAPGSTVLDLEAASGQVYAAVPSTDGTVRIETSPVGSDRWTGASSGVPVGAGPVPAAQIVLHGKSGWLLENDRTVVGGARLIQGRWVPWQPPCATVEGPVFLAASSASNLVAVCQEGLWGGSSQPIERAYVSSDGGTTFPPTRSPLPANQQGTPAVGATSRQVIVVGTSSSSPTGAGTAVLIASFDGGATWSTVFQSLQISEWADVGFTSPTQGVAIGSGSNSLPGALLMTVDGGHTWNAVAFRQAS